jgi:asparagine synthase (glutamine-hydrolysing)
VSAIAGLIRFDGRPIAPLEIEEMLERLAARGPDGVEVWRSGVAALACGKLAVTAESLAERLPLESPGGELVLTAAARIDNREELLALLEPAGGWPAPPGDGELILAAYRRWGEQCPERLLGDFAFAVWDAPRRTLFAARDPLGVRPLYYHRGPRHIAFASDITALLALPEVPRRPSERRIADFLAVRLEDKETTFYEEVLRLPPAHSFRASDARFAMRRYWRLDPRREIRLASDGEYAEAFRETFSRAVACRLRSVHPVGSMLSGGLDSSAIACSARRLLEESGRGPLHTFSAVFDDLPQCDERVYIDEVLAGGGCTPHFVRGDRLDPFAGMEAMLERLGQPFHGPNFFLHHALFATARNAGVRILLDGIDGDTTVSHGLPHLDDLARSGRFLALARELAALHRRRGTPWPRLIFARVLRPLVPEPLRNLRRIGRRGRVDDGPLGIIHPDLARRGEPREPLAPARSPLSAVPASRAEHWRRLTRGLIPHALEVLDAAGGALGLEPAFPFFDARLVALCLAFPPEQKIRSGWTRFVLRNALDGILPERIRWRGGKSNLSPILPHNLLRSGREVVEEVLWGNNGEGLGAFIELPRVRAAWRRVLARPRREQPDRGMRRDVIGVWNAVLLGIWLRRALKRPATAKHWGFSEEARSSENVVSHGR